MRNRKLVRKPRVTGVTGIEGTPRSRGLLLSFWGVLTVTTVEDVRARFAAGMSCEVLEPRNASPAL